MLFNFEKESPYVCIRMLMTDFAQNLHRKLFLTLLRIFDTLGSAHQHLNNKINYQLANYEFFVAYISV